MKDKWTKIILIQAAFLVILFGLFFATCYINSNRPQIIETDTIFSTKTDTFFKTDTFKIEKLIPKNVVILKKDTVYTKDSTEIVLTTENKMFNDTITCEKDTVQLQIFTSGINVNVDSLNLMLKKQEIVKTNTIEITKYVEKPKTFLDKFKVGVGVGYGIGLNSRQFEPYAGITAIYSF